VAADRGPVVGADRAVDPAARAAPRGPGGRPRIDDRAALRGSCSCSTPAAAGGTCRRSWAAVPGTRRGGGCASGRTLACGTGCTDWSSTGSPRRSRWTGRAAVSTGYRCGRRGGRADRPQPHRPGESRLEVPHPVRCERAPAARLALGGEHSRQQAVRATARYEPGRARSPRPTRTARRRPDKLHAGKGYDYRRCRAYLTRRGTEVRIARRGIEDKSKLGRVRWVIERWPTRSRSRLRRSWWMRSSSTTGSGTPITRRPARGCHGRFFPPVGVRNSTRTLAMYCSRWERKVRTWSPRSCASNADRSV